VEGDALMLQAGIVSLDRRRLAAKRVNADSVVTALRTKLLALPGMLRVDRVSTLAAAAARGDVIARRWLHAIPTDFQAELTVTFKPGYYWYTTRYATHGSPHDLDARIPILLMGPLVKPGRYAKPVYSVDVAPTLAEMLGIPPTERVDGRVLTEALRRP